MKKKQMAIIFTFFLVMAIMISACGKEDMVNEPETIESTVDIETIIEEIPAKDLEETSNSETSIPVETEQPNTETDTNTKKEQQVTEETTKPSEPQPIEKTKEQSVEETEEQGQEVIEQSVPTATLNGHIDSIGNGEFVIRKSNVISSDVIVSSGEDAEKVSVIYKDSTEFVLCSTSDGGITTDYSTASSSNLCNDRMVEIEGWYEGNYFVAKKVIIYNFQ